MTYSTTLCSGADILLKTTIKNVDREPNDTEVYIPLHKCMLIENLPYFKNMYNQDSNWHREIDEHTNCDILDGSLLAQGDVLIEYFKSMYAHEDLKPTKANTLDLVKLADFLGDTPNLQILKKYVANMISLDNFIEFLGEPFISNYGDILVGFLTDLAYFCELYWGEGHGLINKKICLSIDKLLNNFYSRSTGLTLDELVKLTKLIPMLKNAIQPVIYDENNRVIGQLSSKLREGHFLMILCIPRTTRVICIRELW